MVDSVDWEIERLRKIAAAALKVNDSYKNYRGSPFLHGALDELSAALTDRPADPTPNSTVGS